MIIETRTQIVPVNPVITAGAYSAGDAVGGLLTFTNACVGARATGVVVSLSLVDKAGQDAELELHLFDQSFTATPDGDAFTVSDADLLNYLGKILIQAADYSAFASNSAAFIGNIGMGVKVAPGSAPKIYGQLLTNGTPTYASTSDLALKLAVLQD